MIYSLEVSFQEAGIDDGNRASGRAQPLGGLPHGCGQMECDSGLLAHPGRHLLAERYPAYKQNHGLFIARALPFALALKMKGLLRAYVLGSSRSGTDVFFYGFRW